MATVQSGGNVFMTPGGAAMYTGQGQVPPAIVTMATMPTMMAVNPQAQHHHSVNPQQVHYLPRSCP